MIVRISQGFVDDSIRECFNSLKSEDDLLMEEDTSQPSSSQIEYCIEVTKAGDNLFLVSVGVLELEYRVSENEVKETLANVVGLILGYQSTVLQGFTVRDSGGNKIKPRIPVFVRSTLDFIVPETLEYLKDKSVEKCEVVSSNSVVFVSFSPIIRSILASGSLMFCSGDTEVVLALHGEKMYMTPNKAEILPMIHRTVSSLNADLFFSFLRSYSFGFIEIFIRAYQSPSSTDANKDLTACFAELRDNNTKFEMECIREVVSAAPVFLDSRDKVTERIEKFYAYNFKGTKRKKGGYLTYRKEMYIDKRPLGSLKRYFRDKACD